MSGKNAPAFITLLTFLLASSATAQQHPTTSAASSPQREPITENLSHGATFKFKIAPDLPGFTFKVIPEPQAADEYGNPQTTVREVQVFRGDSRQPVQSLEDCELSDMEAPRRGSEWFRAVDMNFDGYKDIYMLTSWGATGNESGCVWLYDPDSGRFEYSKDFAELGRFTLDPATKTIVTHSNGGMAGTVFRAAKYLIEDNRPVAIATVLRIGTSIRRNTTVLCSNAEDARMPW